MVVIVGVTSFFHWMEQIGGLHLLVQDRTRVLGLAFPTGGDEWMNRRARRPLDVTTAQAVCSFVQKVLFIFATNFGVIDRLFCVH
jgi:hypothetical protein